MRGADGAGMKGTKHNFAGREFIERNVSELHGIAGESGDEERKILFPHEPPDDYIEFPIGSEFIDFNIYVGSGIASHQVEREHSSIRDLSDVPSKGFSATQLEVFKEDDWFLECHEVLNAHGWFTEFINLSEEIISKVAEKEGVSEITRARARYGENWAYYIAEVAAKHFAKPLSRLWYVANMTSLYFAHQDDMRLGFLWSEYRIRMRHEADSFRGKKNIASARSGGLKSASMQKNRTV